MLSWKLETSIGARKYTRERTILANASALARSIRLREGKQTIKR
jgi:hypothetical protein